MTLQELRTILYYVFGNKDDFLEWRVNLVKEICGENFEADVYIYSYQRFDTISRNIYIKEYTKNIDIKEYSDLIKVKLTPRLTYVVGVSVPRFGSINKVKVVYSMEPNKVMKIKPLLYKWLRNKKDYEWLRRQALFKYFVEL